MGDRWLKDMRIWRFTITAVRSLSLLDLSRRAEYGEDTRMSESSLVS